MATASYGPPRSAEERAAFGSIAAAAFAFPPSDAAGWFERAGHDNLRVIRLRREVVGGLMLIPMGQFFGGRRVAMTGIAGVAVAPWARSGGAATDLMRRCVRELHARGEALSTLYPATVPLYHRAGYERCGSYFRIELPLRMRSAAAKRLAVRPAVAEDEPALRALYRAYACERPGWLDRGDYIWSRVRRPRGAKEVYGLVIEDRGSIAAYLFYHQQPNARGYDLSISDMAARGAAGASALALLLSDHRSLGGRALWHGGVDDPLVAAAPEYGCRLELEDHWMVRIVDVAAALEQRGYPALIETSLDFEVRDDVIADNQGRWRLEVSGGQGRARRGGRGGLALDVRTLAMLYAGYVSAPRLWHDGRLSGRRDPVMRAQALFAGPAPSMGEMF
jgi:predicted acetyltransferase